jgi:hypothetical protein
VDEPGGGLLCGHDRDMIDVAQMLHTYFAGNFVKAAGSIWAIQK